MPEFTGIFSPIPTPFEGEEVAYHHLLANLKKWNEFTLGGYVLLGSNGESVMLTEAEALQVVETAEKYIPEDKRIIVGAGRESTRQTVDFIKKISAIGGDAVLVIPPHYYRGQMTAEAVEAYYLQVAEQSPLPLIIYNVPKFTGLQVPLEAVARLGEHPNIVGMKDSSGDITYQQEILNLGLPDFQLLTGTANTLLPSLVMGVKGGILALANIAPQVCLDIFRAVQTGDISRARELQLKAVRLNRLTTSVYGIGGLKFALDRIGYYGGPPRHPLLPPDERGRKEILAELRKLGLV